MLSRPKQIRLEDVSDHNTCHITLNQGTIFFTSVIYDMPSFYKTFFRYLDHYIVLVCVYNKVM